MHYPKNAEELKNIIIAARDSGTALVPVSSGAPHIHGASVNATAETVSFEKMKAKPPMLCVDKGSRRRALLGAVGLELELFSKAIG